MHDACHRSTEGLKSPSMFEIDVLRPHPEETLRPDARVGESSAEAVRRKKQEDSTANRAMRGPALERRIVLTD